jgi:hypothetical protein
MRISRSRFTRKTTLIATSVIMATVFTTTSCSVLGSSSKADTSNEVTATDVAAAFSNLKQKDPKLISEAIKSTETGSIAAATYQRGTFTQIDRRPEMGVTIWSKTMNVRVSIPNADKAKPAVRMSNGGVTYPGTGGSAQSVIPNKDGFQLLTTIGNAEAPTRYTYLVNVPSGGKVEITENGNANVVSDTGKSMLIAPKAWAKDANGKSVPTHFETDGKSLTQVVEHTNGNYAYPIVADPQYYWMWIKFDRWETGQLAPPFTQILKLLKGTVMSTNTLFILLFIITLALGFYAYSTKKPVLQNAVFGVFAFVSAIIAQFWGIPNTPAWILFVLSVVFFVQAWQQHKKRGAEGKRK